MFSRYSIRALITVATFSVMNIHYVCAYSEFDLQKGNILRAKVSTEFGYTDNFLSEAEDLKETSFLLLRPTLFLQTEFEHSLLQINLDTKHYKYQNFSSDDHSNFTITPKYHYKFDTNKSVYFSGEMRNEFEVRGTGLSRGEAELLKTADEKNTYLGKLGFLYGHAESVAKLNFEMGIDNSRFSTRREQTSLVDGKEFFANNSFDYLFSDNSYITTDLNYKIIEFKNNPLLDKVKYVGLVGFKWTSTEITQFDFLVGYQKINFDNSILQNDSAFKWRVDVNWRPTLLTHLRVFSERDFEETNQLSNSYRVVDSYNLTINSSITDFFNASVDIGYRQEDIFFETDKNNENYFLAKLTLNYQRNDWLSLFLSYSYNQVDSNIVNNNSTVNGISVGFSATI